MPRGEWIKFGRDASAGAKALDLLRELLVAQERTNALLARVVWSLERLDEPLPEPSTDGSRDGSSDSDELSSWDLNLLSRPEDD